MDRIDLDELERLAKAATPGPWKEGRHDMFSIVEGAHAKYIYANSIPIAISTGEENDCERVLADARYIAAACNAVPSLIARVRELERERELYRERLHESWNQTEYCIDLLHDAGVNLTMWACGVESCQQCDVPECDMGDLDMVEKYASRKAIEQAARDSH